MSDTKREDEANVEQDGAATPEPTGQEQDGGDALGEGGLKALRDERDARKAAEHKVKELEERLQSVGKSSDERVAALEKKLAALEEQKETERLTNVRSLAVREAGLPADAVELITATSDEDVAAQVERLKSLVAHSTKSGLVVNELGGGQEPDVDPAQEFGKALRDALGY